MKNFIISLHLIASLFSLLSCGQSNFATYTDPRENAFTVSLPSDWKTQVSLERPHGQIRSCGVSVSPDGKSKVFFGDPTLPTYMAPNPQFGMYKGANTGNPLMAVMPFVPAEQFFTGYIQNRYGKLPGFAITGTDHNPEYQQFVQQKIQEAGIPGQVSTVSVSFVYQDNGEEVKARINGTSINMETAWVADVNGFMTKDNPEDMEPILDQLVTSHETNPAWTQKLQMENQQKMAESQRNHQLRMQQRQQAFNAHQQRMQERYRAADAQYESWRQNQAIQDRSHEQFIDYIRDENTITNSSGTMTGKVETGYNNYYVNPNTGEYIGTNSYTNPDPSLYQHWNIKW